MVHETGIWIPRKSTRAAWNALDRPPNVRVDERICGLGSVQYLDQYSITLIKIIEIDCDILRPTTILRVRFKDANFCADYLPRCADNLGIKYL